MSDKFRYLSTEWSHGTDGCPPSGQGRTKAPWPSAPKTFRRVDTLRSSPLSSRAIWERGIPAFFANAAWVSSARLRKYQRQRLSGQRAQAAGAPRACSRKAESKSGFANASLRRTARAESENFNPIPLYTSEGMVLFHKKLKIDRDFGQLASNESKSPKSRTKLQENGPRSGTRTGAYFSVIWAAGSQSGPGGLRTNSERRSRYIWDGASPGISLRTVSKTVRASGQLRAR